MHARWIRGAAAFALTLAPVAPLAATPVASPVEAADSVRSPARVTDRLVVISIDGLRPDAISRFRATRLQRLMREGTYSLQARTILPSRTLPSHTSMLTGVGPESHGVTWNEDETDTRGVVQTPTIFARASQAGYTSAAFFSKTKFHHLQAPSTLDFTQAPEGSEKWSAARTAANVETYLEGGAQPDLLFVHLADPDYAGHDWSWMSYFYGRAVRRADEAVGRVLAAADQAYGRGNYTVLVTADHGGSGWTHGSSDARDVTIPWIVWGKGVQAGAGLAEGIRTVDTAATALWLLGVEVPGEISGTPVTGAFTAGALTALAQPGA